MKRLAIALALTLGLAATFASPALAAPQQNAHNCVGVGASARGNQGGGLAPDYANCGRNHAH